MLIQSQYRPALQTFPLLWRIPDTRTSILSFQKSSYLLKERFYSLLSQGGTAKFMSTPLNFFSWIPSQHVQMNLGLLHSLGFQWKSYKYLSLMSLQQFSKLPYFQSNFQNLITQGSLASSTLSPYPSPLNTNLETQINNPEPEVTHRLQQINADRSHKGLPPVNLQATTQEIENIMNNPSLSDKEKKKQIAAIRKRLGLGKKDMKTLFTQRLKKIYENVAAQIHIRLQNTVDPTEQARLTQLLQQYESKASIYNSMFKSVWSKMGGAFKKIGGFFKKVAGEIFKIAKFFSPFLKFIPGIGQIASLAGSVFGKVYHFFKDKILEIAKPIQGFFSSPINTYVQPWLDQTKIYLQKLIQPF